MSYMCHIAPAVAVALIGVGLCFTPTPTRAATTVFEENFNSYKDGEHPSSVVELHEYQTGFGEVIGGRFATHYANRFMLVAPKVKDFDLSFTVEPHPRATRSPCMQIEFRTDPRGRKGYRILHWMGARNRLDLWAWDYTVSPAVDRSLVSPEVPALTLPTTGPIRFALSVRDQAIVFSRNDQVLLAYTNTTADATIGEPGNITFTSHFELRDNNVVSPLFFDNFRLDTPERQELGRVVYARSFDTATWFRGVEVPLRHNVRIVEVPDTGLDALRADTPSGRVYRVEAGVTFQNMVKPPFRSMAARTPYVRIERPDGSLVLDQRIFNGILGNMWPGHGGPHAGGVAQLLRLMTDYETPPRYGVVVRTQQAADATGPQSSVRYLTSLPDDFTIAPGWEYIIDPGNVEIGGSVETIFRKDGSTLYTGAPLGENERVLTLGFPVSQGILSRVSTNNSRREWFTGCLSANAYFLEGEPVNFTVSLTTGTRADTQANVRWRLLDGFRRPVKDGEGTLVLTAAAATNDQAKTLRSIGRGAFGAPLPLALQAPGVYWLDLDCGATKLQKAFSVVPKDQRPGNTAAHASGIPVFQEGLVAYAKNSVHYISLCGAGNAEDLEIRKALNMEIPGCAPSSVAGWPSSAGPRLWFGAFKAPTVQAFLASKAYRPCPEDAPLRDPAASEEEKGRIIVQFHFKEWVDHWCAEAADKELAARESKNQRAPGMVSYYSYGPPLLNSYYYGSAYGGRYYGWDARLMAKTYIPGDSYRMETYAYDFGREPASYVPSLALTRLAIPALRCRWELYGAGGYVNDYRTVEGCPPQGLHYPSPEFMAHQTAEFCLGAWFFDGQAFQTAGNTHVDPAFYDTSSDMIIGTVNGLRAAADATNLVPVRCPAFVNSWAAADLDPSWTRGALNKPCSVVPLDPTMGTALWWQRGVLNNSAAEAPAYAFLQSRLAGLAGGFFLDIENVGKLDRRRADMLVLPSMRGATPEQVAAIRKHYEAGMALVCFDDATGLEDLFGIRRLDQGVAVAGVERTAGDTLLAGLDPDVLAERTAFEGTVRYEVAGAAEVLSATDATGKRVAPMLSVHRPAGKPGAVFFAAGATEVGRRSATYAGMTYEGEVLGKLVQHAMRRAMTTVADPVVSVSAPGTVLAFRRPNGNLYVVVMEGSYPRPTGKPVDVELTLRAPGAERARLTCASPLREIGADRGERRVTLTLQPDEVVSILVDDLRQP